MQTSGRLFTSSRERRTKNKTKTNQTKKCASPTARAPPLSLRLSLAPSPSSATSLQLPVKPPLIYLSICARSNFLLFFSSATSEVKHACGSSCYHQSPHRHGVHAHARTHTPSCALSSSCPGSPLLRCPVHTSAAASNSLRSAGALATGM